MENYYIALICVVLAACIAAVAYVLFRPVKGTQAEQESLLHKMLNEETFADENEEKMKASGSEKIPENDASLEKAEANDSEAKADADDSEEKPEADNSEKAYGKSKEKKQ